VGTTAVHAAETFFAGTATGDWGAVRAVVADGAVFWQNVDGRERTLEQVIRYTSALHARGGFSYLDVRRLVAPDGFCEQHTVRFRNDDGVTDHAVCAVGRIDDAGRIVRLDEYLCLPGGTRTAGGEAS
jgi:hypothetical protein